MNVLKGAYLLDSTNEVVLEKYRSKYIAWDDCEMAAYYNNKYYEASPDGSSYGYYRIASCYYDAENYTEAKKYFQKYSSLNEDANYGNFGLVRCERKLQNYDESLEIINKMIEADSTEYNFYERALTFMAMGDYESAIDDLTTIIEFDPCNCEYYEKRAEYYEKLNMNDLAARDREIMEILFCGKLDEFYYYDN
jgi:tetratricopeptide (TPR) repeat protein